MSFLDEYNKALAEEKKKKKKTGSYMDEYRSSLAQMQKEEDIAPVPTTTKSSGKKEGDGGLDFFQKGAFDDGYQFGDVTKAILGTVGDAGLGVVKGFAGVAEGVGDLITYGIAGVADAIGEDEYAKGVRQRTQENLIDKWTKPAEDYLDQYSVLGRTSDSIAQGVGQLGAIVATGGVAAGAGLGAGGVSAVTTGLLGASGVGSGMSEAYQGGANDLEALKHGLNSGAADAVTELIFGGLGKSFKALGFSKGLSSADDMLAKVAGGKFKNKIAKNIVEYGVKSGAEGLEEVLAGFAQAYSKHHTYMSDEDFAEILKDENLLEQFLVGAATSGLAQGGDLVRANQSGRDFVSNMTQNEQKVVDKVFEDTIAEKTKNGEKVSGREKNKIYDSIVKDMEKGYISTDTIEEVLGGDTYKSYKDTAENEDSILKEFEDLGNLKKSDFTAKQEDRYNELKEMVAEIKKNDSRSQLQSQLSSEVSEMVKDDRLIESYNERSRKGESFTADLSKYDTKQQEVIKRATESGILNNTRRTHEFVDMVAKISADKGVLFDFTNNEKLKGTSFAKDGAFVNGYYDPKSKSIGVNIDSSKAVNTIVGHEITHVLEGTDIYNELQTALFEYAKSKGEYESRRTALSKMYAAEDIDTELAADIVGDYLFTDHDFINNLSTKHRNVFQKIYDEIKYLCKVATAGSKEARELEKVKRAFEKAYRESGKADGDAKYSLSDSDGKQLTKEQQEYFKDSKVRDENGNLKVMYHGSQDAGFHVFDASMSDDNTSFFFVDRNEVATTYSGTSETYEAKTIRSAEDMNKFLAEIGYDQYEAVETDGRFELLEDGDHVAYSDTAQGIYEEFCWYEGVGDGDVNYKVYLNLKNPLEVDAKGRNWDNVSREYSQEVADKYKTLASDEKAALYDLAQWGEFSIFRDEINNAIDVKAPITEESEILASAYYKLQDKDGKVNLYDLYSIAEDNFSVDAINQFAVKQLNTRDYAQRAKEQGYDGVIFKNIVDIGGYGNGKEGAATVAIAFESNQIKSVANEKPTGDKDIRYSLSDSNGKKLSNEQALFFKDSVIRDENGNLMPMYHGTPNGAFTVFKDGTYFTPNKEYADKYQNPGASSISTGKVASNPKTFEVYLNIKKPFDINDAEARSIYINEYIKGGNAMGINPYLSDAEYAKINSIDWTEGEDLRDFLIDNEYDYDGLVLDEGATGGYGDEVQSRGKSYVVFSPEQVKNIDNQTPTSDPDIRFSLSEPVEQTKDLMAIHNLTEQKLLKSLKLGGLPMPSVAIARASDGHGDFGEISLILPKEAIDPMTSRNNKLYSGDAWTPTYPKVEYKLNSKALKQIEKKLSTLIPNEVMEFGRLALDTDNMTDTLNRYGGDMVDAFKGNYALKYAYLKEVLDDIQLPMKEKNISYHGSRENGAIIKVAESIPADEIEKAIRGGSDEIRKLEPAVRKAVAEYVRETYGDDQFILDTFAPADGLSFSDLDGYLVEARKYLRTGVEQTVDTRPAQQMIDDMTVQYSYEEWLNSLFSDIVEKEGIRNNADYFTPSGNRRSFEALHYEHNLENVIKAMREKGDKGIGFGGGSIFGAATTEFSSVEEMKQNSGRLQKMSEEEYQEIKEGFSDRFFELARSLPHDKSSFMATDDAANVLTEAVAKYKTKSGMANYLRRELKGWADYSPQVVDDLIQLVNDIRKMPTGYFEAKPQRAVGFDEVGVFVIPNNADVKLKQELLNRGYAIAEYDPSIDGHRQQVVNQFEDYKFSISDKGQTFKKYGTWNVYGKDIALDAPVREDVQSPTKETTKYSVEEMFPDVAPIEQELEQLEAERAEIYSGLETAVATGNANEVGQLAADYDSLTARIRELEGEISETEKGRADSLMGEEAPPEIAPVYTESESESVDDPFKNRDWYNIGNQKSKAYMDEHPELKPFFREEAMNLLGELNDTTRGERWYNDQLHYESGGENGWGGTKRHTSESMEELLDSWRMSYDDIEKGLKEIIDDAPKKHAAAKKIEFMLNDRLLHGYKNFYDTGYIEPNRGYIEALKEVQYNESNKGYIDALVHDAENLAPLPTESVYTDSFNGVVKGQESYVTMEDKLKNRHQQQGSETIAPLRERQPNSKVANVLTEDPAIAKQKPGIFSKLVAATVDKGMVFENLSLEKGNHEIQAKWNYALPTNTEARAQYYMANGEDGVTPLKDIMEVVNESGKKDSFFDYLYQWRNVDSMTLEERFDIPNMTVYGDTVTADVSRKKIAQYEKANPEFKAWADKFYAIGKDLRKKLVEGNIITQKTADWWEEKYPHYVPIGRVDKQGQNISVPLDTNKTGVNNPVKKATGGNSDLRPLDVVMAERIEQTFRAIARNSFGIELKNTLGTTVAPQPKPKQTRSEVHGQLQFVDEVIDTIEAQDDKLLKPGTQNSAPTFTVFENGERVEFEITEDMYDALKPVNKVLAHRFENSDSKLSRGVGKALNARRNLLTVWNPVFALYRNPIKDIQDVAVNSQHAVKTYKNIPNAIYQMAVGGEYAEEYHRNGGKSNTYFDGRNKKFKTEDNAFKKIIGMPVRAIENAGEIIEEIPRLAEYIASRQEGRSVERSMLDAARVTTNFAAGGDFTKFLNTHGFTFLNASVQGASQHVRNFREAKQEGMKGYVKVLAKYAIAGLPTILLNSLLWDDDEEYEELADYVKQNYYVVAKTQDGKFVRIPKGRTAAVMGELMNQMENLVTGDDEVDFSTFYELFMNNIAPSNPMENNIIAPVLQTATNKAWYGGDLVPERLQKLPDEEQFDESTDSISKWLGENIGGSPYKWNYLIDQYSGGLGDVFLPMLTPEAESGDDSAFGNLIAPWKKEITTDKVLNNKNPGDFYDLRDELEKKANSSKATEEDAMRSMYMDSVSWDMSDLYKQKREIQNSDLSDSEKYEQVREIQEQINELAKSAMGSYNDISVTGLYAEIGDRRYNKDAESGKWYEINAENADGTPNSYYEKEQKVTKALGISPAEYWNNREEYNYAYDKPEQYALSQAVGGYQSYRGYTSELWDIKADKDENGKSISGSRKEKVIDYLNNLDIDYYHKIILFKNEYNADDTYNYEIIDYLNGREDISYTQMETILKYLGFEVDSDGNISW